MVHPKWLRYFPIILVLVVVLVSARAMAGHDEPVPLAIQGYDPVAYFEMSEPTLGDPAFHHVWDGLEYRFVSDRHLALFQTAPDRYAPRYRNFCAGALARGHKVEADPRNWLIHDGRLFLFGGKNGPAAMATNPDETMKKADAFYATLPRTSE